MAQGEIDMGKFILETSDQKLFDSSYIANSVMRGLEAARENGFKWARPWVTRGAAMNGSTKHVFTRSNQWLLSLYQMLFSYDSNVWFTPGQAIKLGCNIKGSTTVRIWRPKVFKTGKINPDTGEEETYTTFTTYGVLNASQIILSEEAQAIVDSLTPEKRDHQGAEVDFVAFAEAYAANAGVGLSWGSDRAAYAPLLDQMVLPAADQYKDLTRFALTNVHEIAHSTGHSSRLDRVLNTNSGSSEYAVEELVAELTSSLVALKSGWADDLVETSLGYLLHWYDRVLKLWGENDRAIEAVHGATDSAIKATAYILEMVEGEDQYQGEEVADVVSVSQKETA